MSYEDNGVNGIAGERVSGFVQLGKDGKIYNSSTIYTPIQRYVVAAADLAKGQRLIFDHGLKGYIPAPEGVKVEGLAGSSAEVGQLFSMIIAFYNVQDDTFKSIDNVVINGD